MRSRYANLVMAGLLALLAAPLAAQMPPGRPNAVRTQLSPSAPSAPAAPAAAPSATPAAAQATVRPTAAPRRDPFDPLLGKADSQGGGASTPERLPPGKAGLMISTMRIDGLVRGPNGMIAVVSSPQQRVYFLREGDRIYDGQVVRISMEAVSFRQTGRDPMGASLEREVTRRLYPSPGEQR